MNICEYIKSDPTLKNLPFVAVFEVVKALYIKGDLKIPDSKTDVERIQPEPER